MLEHHLSLLLFSLSTLRLTEHEKEEKIVLFPVYLFARASADINLIDGEEDIFNRMYYIYVEREREIERYLLDILINVYTYMTFSLTGTYIQMAGFYNQDNIYLNIKNWFFLYNKYAKKRGKKSY